MTRRMSAAQFRDLELASPQINLGIGSGHHGAQTARMLAGLEEIILEQTPDWVLVYGDTNSTLAGALAAAKLRVPVAHVEAGQRSYNRCMPEETNRVADRSCVRPAALLDSRGRRQPGGRGHPFACPHGRRRDD